jgi:asparaginyl-tRNA synthetase
MSAHGAARRTPIRHLLASAAEHGAVEVTGWVKTSRFSKNVSFIHIFDGSTTKTIQVVLSAEQAAELQTRLGIGASLRVTGRWVKSPGGEQALEVAADRIEVLGDSDAETYPIQKKATSFEYLRTIAHLRTRTNTFQSVFRVRNAVSWQIHKFFQERGFLWVHTPIIATADCEGAGEMFEIHTSHETPFFGTPAMLTVSGQLQVETFAEAFCDVYTFGPTFRAENSNTSRHAAEFWMVEPEIAFGDLNDVIALAEDFIREVARGTMAQCPDDFQFFDDRIEKGVIASIEKAISKPFDRITYAEAQEILKKSGRAFENPIGWGESLQSEHERFLAEQYFQGPVFVTDYPTEQKAFYMRLSDDERTVAATDLLVPRIGEIIGGSQREERLDVLQDQLRKRGMDSAPLWWYLDLRRFGSVPHGGFGLGLERMIMWLTGMQNIRDVVPFPRTPGNAAF